LTDYILPLSTILTMACLIAIQIFIVKKSCEYFIYQNIIYPA